MAVKYRNWVNEGINGANLPACFESPIGGGKTTAVRTLADILELVPLFEDIGEMDQMAVYYRALSGDSDYIWALIQTQYWLMARRFSQHENMFIDQSVEFLSDRSLIGDIGFDWALFKQGKISKGMYNKIVSGVLKKTEELVEKNMFFRKAIWLDVSAEVSHYRIHEKRGIKHEIIPIDYLKLLREGYIEKVLPIFEAMGILEREDWNEDKDLVTENGLNYLKDRPEGLIGKLKEGSRIWTPQKMPPKQVYDKILLPEDEVRM